MAAVVMALRAALVAEAALRRVDPVSTSGPVGMAITTSAIARRPGRGAQVTSTVRRPRARAVSRPPRTNGVTELAEIPMRTSPVRSLSASARPSSSRSSAPSTARNTASSPPAMTARMRSGSVPNVGGHSAASSTPRRPLVPAPRNTIRPPPSSALATRSAARAIAARWPRAATSARRSSSRRSATARGVDRVSRRSLRGLRLSVRSRAQGADAFRVTA
jgi:hypothetical protein